MVGADDGTSEGIGVGSVMVSSCEGLLDRPLEGGFVGASVSKLIPSNTPAGLAVGPADTGASVLSTVTGNSVGLDDVKGVDPPDGPPVGGPDEIANRTSLVLLDGDGVGTSVMGSDGAKEGSTLGLANGDGVGPPNGDLDGNSD